MVHDELDLPFMNNSARPTAVCTHCGATAAIHLTVLANASHQGEYACLACGEALIHSLQQQHAADEIEHGIIYWEGHGWSSDGPFAGA